MKISFGVVIFQFDVDSILIRQWPHAMKHFFCMILLHPANDEALPDLEFGDGVHVARIG
jgi:hypothetical protein